MAIGDLIPWSRNRSVAGSRPQDEQNPVLALHREMNRLFDNFFRGIDFPIGGSAGWPAGGWAVGSWPHVEVSDSDDDVKVVAELPGIDEKDIEVSLQDGLLTIRGEKKSETQNAVYSERWQGRFERTVRLGPDVDPDKVSAAFKNGVLTVTAQKRPEAQRQTRRIEVKSG
jgi:HSP20 family protein